MKKRSAWTDAPIEQDKLTYSGPGRGPLRSILLKSLAHSPQESLTIDEFVDQAKDISDEALAKAIKEAIVDGIVDVQDDTIFLTTLGHRAARTVY